MKALTAYQTTDGQTFFDQNEAALHQSALDNAEFIAEFCTEVGMNPRTAKTFTEYAPALILKVQQRFHEALAESSEAA